MRSHAAAGLLGLLALSAAAPAAALPPICVRDLPDRMDRWIRVPIGCEVVDCCPGCPGGPLDLRIRVSGAALAGAELRIEGVAERGPIPIRKGETRLAGIARARDPGAPPIAALRLRPDEKVLAGWRDPARRRPPGPEPLDPVVIEVEQRLGDVVVNAFRSEWQVLACPRPRTCDRIVQSGIRGGDESVLLIDARRTTGSGVCVDDEIQRASGSQPVGNLLAPQGCRSEVAILSSDDALELVEDVEVWTDDCGDELAVALKPAWTAPATFFLAVPDAVALFEWGETVETVAQEDLDDAIEIYRDNKTGISFAADMKPVGILELPKLMAAFPLALLEALKTSSDPLSFVCGVTSALKSAGFYEPGRLNVYYLAVPGTGMICPDDRNIVFVALGRKPATLAHEFGHSLSLLGTWGHTTDLAGFDSTNVMWGGSDVRDHFSLGQAFRQNLEPVSTINTNQVRQGPLRSCPLTLASPECPPLASDWPRP